MPATSMSTTPTSVVGIVEAQQALLGLSNQEIWTGIGFEREIALQLIKAGAMKMPLAKIPALSARLQFDAAELLRVALCESGPALATLIKHQRSLCGDAVGAPITLQGEDVIALVGV